MDYKDRWDKKEELGQGGQGIVHRVLDKDKYDFNGKIMPTINDSIFRLGNSNTVNVREEAIKGLTNALLDLVKSENSLEHGALKELHKPEESKDAKQAMERIQIEIKIMSEITHPNLLKIYDHDPDGKWFVSEFHPGGILTNLPLRYKGRLQNSLEAIRPVVEGVKALHDKNVVHRDIKPDNIFINKMGDLVLGDFGLVLFTDSDHKRVSNTYENVGSRDWMPGWAQGARIEELKPSFDVFSLGKVIWSMISGKSFLRLWYYNKNQFDIVKQFTADGNTRLLNQLLAKCVVENEEDCLSDASALLEVIDETLYKISLNADPLEKGTVKTCNICGDGHYLMISSGDPKSQTATHNFGIEPVGSRRLKIFTCENCGHVLLFETGAGRVPPIWGNL